MAKTSIAFLIVMVVCCVGALRFPVLGVFGYMLAYLVNPATEWWSRWIPVERFSLLMAIFLAIGLIFSWQRTARLRPRFGAFELLLLLMLAIMWLSTVIGPPLDPAQTSGLLDKMTKLFIFLFMLKRVVLTRNDIHAVFWAILIGGLYMGWGAFNAPESDFLGGRLISGGGPDFQGDNEFGLHLAATLPIAAALLFRFRKLWQRAPVVVAVLLMLNTIVMTRSRTAFVALAIGFVSALFYAPRRYRLPLVGLAGLGLIAFLTVADVGFWSRMNTIKDPEHEVSANLRLTVWKGSIPMFLDHPAGIGIGNFGLSISQYAPDLDTGRDSHNTFVSCYTELGIQGIIVLLLILASAWRSLGKATKLAREIGAVDMELYAYVLRVSFVVYLVGGMTVKRLYAEGLWWYIVLPGVLLNIVMVLQRDRPAAEAEVPEPGQRGMKPRLRPRPAAPIRRTRPA